mmetsp:Transcript_7933/g.11959  ORF Transcript_7933/g.11959 Transcript_7933/m.11959 type:complete len:361 (-) Transcript_7933:130-1212(-)
MTSLKDSKKRQLQGVKGEGKMESVMDAQIDLKADGPNAKRQKLEGRPDIGVPPDQKGKGLSVNGVNLAFKGQFAGTAAATAAAAAAAALQTTKNLANGLPTGIQVMPPGAGSLASVAAAANLMGPLNAVPPPHLHPQLLAGQNFPVQGLTSGGNHNQIKSFLDHISLGQYWRLLSDNGCDTLEDLATADVQMLVNLGFKIFHANRLVTAVHRFIRPAPPVISTPAKRKRASHVRTFAEMYQRVDEFQALVNQVGSMSAAERDPRSTISRGAYTQYLRIKELAEKERIDLTSDKYVNVKPTEKNVREIIQKEKQNREQQQQSGVNQVPPGVPAVPSVHGVPAVLTGNRMGNTIVPEVVGNP